MSSNHNTSESGQTDSSGRTSLVFSIRGPIPIQLGKNPYIRLYTYLRRKNSDVIWTHQKFTSKTLP